MEGPVFTPFEAMPHNIFNVRTCLECDTMTNAIIKGNVSLPRR